MLYFRYFKIALILIFVQGNAGILQASQDKIIHDSLSYYINKLADSQQLSDVFPDEAYENFSECYRFFKQKRDTNRIVQCLISMSDIQRLKRRFSTSFDNLWEAQYLINKSDDYPQRARVHRGLARLYDIYEMDNEALHHLEQALQISKKIVVKEGMDALPLNASYMALAGRQHRSGNYYEALSYLDSCTINNRMLIDQSVAMPFLDAERGYIMMKLGNVVEAQRYLNLSKTNAEKQNLRYRANIYTYLGELKMALSEPDSAIYYFNKGLELIDSQHMDKMLTVNVLLKLSEIYLSQNNDRKAYELLKQSTMLADSLILAKNSANSELFKIKNTFLESINQKDELIEMQDAVIQQNNQIQFRLKIILALLLLLGFVLVLIIRLRLKLHKTLLDKQETEMQSKLMEERSKAKIEAKSKELTSYALQLIDKDSIIDELLEVLKNEAPSAFRPWNTIYKKSSRDLWDQFNLRFTEVNLAFYNRLKTKHPGLSPTEQKHCALIKLNFATKEMARILNIETHSVHISRSRIRKKIGLQRSESLEKYISDL